MNARAFAAAAAFTLLSSLAGCSEDDGHTPAPPPPPSLGINASASSVVANGTNAVAITVTDTGGGPIAVTTSRGAFATGGQSANVPGASGALTLVTCNSATSSSCAGTAVVTATSTSGSTSTSITFGALADACQPSCGADPACPTQACALPAGGSGTCSQTSPSTCISGPACTPSPAGATTETSCEDGVDNDCDGDVDCDDAACGDQACQAGSPTFFCRSGACTDISSGLAVEVTPARTRLPAVTGATTSVVVAVTAGGEPAAGMAVALAATAGTLSATSGTTGGDGKVTVTFTGSATPAVAVITASLTAIPTIRDDATITLPRLGSFQLTDAPLQFPVMGAKGSAWNEFGWVKVQVLDDVGLPYPDGLVVRFEHGKLGGSTLGAPLVTPATGPCSTATNCVAFDGVVSSGIEEPDSTGLASAWLYSGTVAGTLAVTASTSAGGETRSVTLPTATVIGAKASGANFSIVCGPRNVPALAETDCAISLVDAPFTCEALLKDRFGNVLGTATQVVFASEASAVGPVATTPAFASGASADLGIATQLFQTLGAGLPFDVAPDAAASEPSVSHGLDGCGTRTHNPRDGAVTVVAIADGEEAFFDANGNGAYDAAPVAEPFVDQGEPFVDQDDDGAYGAGEWFLDVDGNRAYTPRNGAWDAATKIWTQTVVVYTGAPATFATGAATFLGTRWADLPLADACAPTAAATPFALQTAQAGPPPVPPTSRSYALVASDLNLNMLHTETTYGVSMVGEVSAEATYHGLESYADDLGFFFRYWPCDQAASPSCSSQCRATGANAPCVMKPSLSDFSCGVAASATIIGGDEPDGAVTASWDVVTPWSVYGTGKVATTSRAVSGTSN